MCDLIDVRLRKDVTVDYAESKRITIVGKFKIKSQIIDGELCRLYRLKKAVVVAE